MPRKGRHKKSAPDKNIRAPIVEGPATGVCNICGVNGPLIQDHAPPKGAVDVRHIKLKSIIRDSADDEQNLASSRILQNGVQYRSICSNCNNNLLRAKYDQSYIGFVAAYLFDKRQLSTTKDIPNRNPRPTSGLGVGRHGKFDHAAHYYVIATSRTSACPVVADQQPAQETQKWRRRP